MGRMGRRAPVRTWGSPSFLRFCNALYTPFRVAAADPGGVYRPQARYSTRAVSQEATGLASRRAFRYVISKGQYRHILGDPDNLERLPSAIREARNLPLLLETAVEVARRKAVVEPSIVVAQGYQGGAVPAADLPDRYGSPRPCHDPHGDEWVLSRQYLFDRG